MANTLSGTCCLNIEDDASCTPIISGNIEQKRCCYCGALITDYLCKDCHDECSNCGNLKKFHDQLCKSCLKGQ